MKEKTMSKETAIELAKKRNAFRKNDEVVGYAPYELGGKVYIRNRRSGLYNTLFIRWPKKS